MVKEHSSTSSPSNSLFSCLAMILKREREGSHHLCIIKNVFSNTSMTSAFIGNILFKSKDENIGSYIYIGTSILWIYQIGGYFDIKNGNIKINKNSKKL